MGLIILGGRIGSSNLYFSFSLCSFSGKRPCASSFLFVALIHFHGLQHSTPWISLTMSYLQSPSTFLISGFSFSGPFKHFFLHISFIKGSIVASPHFFITHLLTPSNLTFSTITSVNCHIQCPLPSPHGTCLFWPWVNHLILLE